jgi:hypothetical protein
MKDRRYAGGPPLRAAELLPVPYFHVVFTLPSAIGDIAYQNKGGEAFSPSALIEGPGLEKLHQFFVGLRTRFDGDRA